MKKILILGSDGMAGNMIYRYLSTLNEYDIKCLSRSNVSGIPSEYFDIESDELYNIISDNEFDYVINCIGVLVKACQDNPIRAIFVNSYFPHYLEKRTKGTSTKIIHISTDCIFSGIKGDYTINDIPDEKSWYGRTKALGEIVNDKDLTIRTSIIGPEVRKEGVGLFKWFMEQTGQVGGYPQCFWNGVTTLELARFMYFAMEHKLTGLVQLSTSNKISKYELLSLIVETFNKIGTSVVRADGIVQDKSLISTVNHLYYVQEYREQLTELRIFMENYYKIVERS